MTEKMGYIYVLTTPSFPNYVKIGYADDVNERLKQLNRSECLPFAFRVYATYAVSSRLSDKKLHTLIDSLNSDLRSVETVDGVKRKREFYAMSPEEAFDLLRNIAEISGTVGKLKLIKPTAEQMKDANTAKEIENERQKNFSFEECHIPVGAIVAFKDNPEITCEVVNDRKVKYNG